MSNSHHVVKYKDGWAVKKVKLIGLLKYVQQKKSVNRLHEKFLEIKILSYIFTIEMGEFLEKIHTVMTLILQKAKI